MLFCNFDNCLSRKMVVVCNDFQRKQKLKKFIILNSYEKMDVCILRLYANVQSEITLDTMTCQRLNLTVIFIH